MPKYFLKVSNLFSRAHVFLHSGRYLFYFGITTIDGISSIFKKCVDILLVEKLWYQSHSKFNYQSVTIDIIIVFISSDSHQKIFIRALEVRQMELFSNFMSYIGMHMWVFSVRYINLAYIFLLYFIQLCRFFGYAILLSCILQPFIYSSKFLSRTFHGSHF